MLDINKSVTNIRDGFADKDYYKAYKGIIGLSDRFNEDGSSLERLERFEEIKATVEAKDIGKLTRMAGEDFGDFAEMAVISLVTGGAVKGIKAFKPVKPVTTITPASGSRIKINLQLFAKDTEVSNAGITVGQNNQSFVYRVLRNSENPVEGLKPKNANAKFPLEDHVIDGNLKTQYISSTTDINIARKWATKDGKRIVKIDLSKLGEYGNDFSIFDLSTDVGRNMYLKQPQAQGYARASSEVVIKGNIPPEAVEPIK